MVHGPSQTLPGPNRSIYALLGETRNRIGKSFSSPAFATKDAAESQSASASQTHTQEGAKNTKNENEVGQTAETAITEFAAESRNSALVLLINDALQTPSFKVMPQESRLKWRNVLAATENEILKARQEAANSQCHIAKHQIVLTEKEVKHVENAAETAQEKSGEEEIRKLKVKLQEVIEERDKSRQIAAHARSEQHFWELEGSKFANEAAKAKETLNHIKSILQPDQSPATDAPLRIKNAGSFTESIRSSTSLSQEPRRIPSSGSVPQATTDDRHNNDDRASTCEEG